MKKTVCLVSLPSPFLVDEKVFPPLGLLYLKKALSYHDIESHVHDGTISEIPSGFSHYAISATTPQFVLAKEALAHIREIAPKAQIVIGGPHATVDPDSCKKAGFDSVVMGEGETALFLAVDWFADIVSVPFHGYLSPDRSALDIRSYRYYIDNRLATSVMTSRGCPYSCAFCCKSAGKCRLFPSELVINELTELHEVYGYDAFMFFDDIFISDRARLAEILATITPWKVKWRGFVRADLLVKGGVEMVRAMKDSGCVEIGMGIESGSEYILKTINKGESLQVIRDAIELAHNAGIRVKGFFIVGLPSESWETVKETEKFCQKTKLDDMDFTIFQPFKGSHIYNNCSQYDINWHEEGLKDLWYKGKQGGYYSNVWTSHLWKDEIVEARDYLERNCKHDQR